MAKHPNSGVEFEAADADAYPVDDGAPKVNIGSEQPAIAEALVASESLKPVDQAFEAAFPGHGEPLAEQAPAQRNAPTAAQHAWMLAHPQYVRSSHFFGRMVERGTLHDDGSFVPESRHPVIDGPSCFAVGIPLKGR